MFQGSSQLTPRKEFEIFGLSKMRLNQFKSDYFGHEEIICADVFCGTGRNVLDGIVVDGSPIKMIDGVVSASNEKVKTSFFFSDIRQEACDALSEIVKAKYRISLPIKKLQASDAINRIGEYMTKNRGSYLFLILDPNGPKDFPKNEVCDLIRAFPARLDITPYISATAINRQLGARNKAGYQLKSWIGEIENFDDGFVKCMTSYNRDGWIRTPVNGDRWRWTMLPTFGKFFPRNDWKKQGYCAINSEDGKKAIKYYCGDFK